MRPESLLYGASRSARSVAAATASWTLLTLGIALELCLSTLRRTYSGVRWATTIVARRLRSLFAGPVRRGLAGPVREALFGRRVEVSLLAGLLSAPLALATTWWAGSTVGYATLERWVRGTWYGTDPALVVFFGVAALLALATASAAVNSGLVPTTLLVAGPVFGASVTRYGTGVTYEYGAAVVSLPNALGVAALFAVAFGVPIALCGFVLGSALRRVAAVLAGRTGRSSRPENV